MLRLSSFFIYFILANVVETNAVDTNVVPNVTCSAEGDVFIRPLVQDSDLTSGSLEPVFASSKDTVCEQQLIEDVVKIHGCVQADTNPLVDVFLRDGTDGLLILRISCSPYGDPLHPETRRITQLNLEGSEYHSVNEISTIRRRRRQEVSKNITKENDENSSKTFQTAVSFSVKLNYSSNDEISIVCNPNNLGILYVSNPDPVNLISVLSFSELTKTTCNAEFLEGRRFVAIGGCNLIFPITISFNSFPLSTIIGGSRFKIYNVSCHDIDSIERANVFTDTYEIGNSGVGQRRSSLFVTMEMLMYTMVCLAFDF